MFNAAKDMIVSRAAAMFLNRKLSRYGSIEKLKIDSRRQTMDITAHLLGEREPISVSVEKYAVVRDRSGTSLRIVACRCERPWLQNVLEDFVYGRSIPLPSDFIF